MPDTPSTDIQRLRNPLTRRAAFADLVGRYSQPLYWKVRQMVQTHDDANDVVQNTFLKAWTALDSYKGEAAVATWLYRIAINESLDLLRRRQRADAREAGDAATLGSSVAADPYFDGTEAEARLHDAIATLPGVQRAVFCMRYFDEMKYSDISATLGTSEGALKASYHIAVQKVKARLGLKE